MVVDVFAFCDVDEEVNEVVACIAVALAGVEEVTALETTVVAAATVDTGCAGELASIDPTTTPVLIAAVAVSPVVRTLTIFVPRFRRWVAVLMMCPRVLGWMTSTVLSSLLPLAL